MKPVDLEKLAPPELAALYRQLSGLHLVQCLGALRELRKDLKDADCRLVQNADGVWEKIPNWNRGRPARDLTEEPVSYDSEPDDWVLRTLAPSCAVSSRAVPLAVVLNYTGEWIDKNRRIQALREVCGPLYQNESE